MMTDDDDRRPTTDLLAAKLFQAAGKIRNENAKIYGLSTCPTLELFNNIEKVTTYAHIPYRTSTDD